MKQVGELAVNFTKLNINTSFDFAENLVRAKDAQELMALHTDYVHAALTDQAKELSKQAAKLAGQASQDG